jgi:succinoglycan biosynthesis transport protein ExoP
MPQPGTPEPASGLSLPDVLHAIFKHKWKIVIAILVGLAGGAAFYLLSPPMYQSEAKLLVRYVAEKSEIDNVDKISPAVAARGSSPVMASELQLMTSFDLAVAVVDKLGLGRFKARNGEPLSRSAAIGAVRSGLEVSVMKGTNVVGILFKYHDPEMATVILNQFVVIYMEAHRKMHRSEGDYEFLRDQSARVRTKLMETEEELKKLKAEAGVISLDDSTAKLNTQLSTLESELRAARTQRAETEARVQALEGAYSGAEAPSAAAAPAAVGASEVQRYQQILAELARLRQAEFSLLAQYTPDSRPMRLHRQQLADAEAQQRAMEERFPALVALAPASSDSASRSMDLPGEKVRLIAVDARIKDLEAQLQELQASARKLAEVGPRISELEIRRKQEQESYAHSQSKLERAQIDEAGDPAKMPNINYVQAPAPAGRAADLTQKIALGIAGGTSALGIGYALLAGLLLDRTVKRSGQLENLLRLPVLLSIPYEKQAKKRLPAAQAAKALAASGAEHGNGEAAPWSPSHFVRPFAEEVRDRLSVFFDLYNITHKPKLVAVTGTMEGAGASTVAAGLAASLSETGGGKVLLVDMNANSAVVHPYFQGHPQVALTSALKPDETEMAPASENLYLASASPAVEEIEQLGPRRFNELVPRLRASDYDYIVFDMPALDQTSATLAMARHMDLVLLLVEAERCTADQIRRTWNDLAGAKANVSVIFNKARNYAPAWLQG